MLKDRIDFVVALVGRFVFIERERERKIQSFTGTVHLQLAMRLSSISRLFFPECVQFPPIY